MILALRGDPFTMPEYGSLGHVKRVVMMTGVEQQGCVSLPQLALGKMADVINVFGENAAHHQQ